jgi:5-methylcytosine-specific restriction endonuclease McrA
MKYIDKLKDPRWQKKRLEILNRDSFTCDDCSDTNTTLVVHHEYYLANTEPWDYEEYCYTTLCEDCHKIRHFKFSNLEKFLIQLIVTFNKERSLSARLLFRKYILKHINGK